MHDATDPAGPQGGRAAASLVLIGGLGDLALRMLLPSLYLLDADGLLGPDLKIVALARHAEPEGGFTGAVEAAVRRAAGPPEAEAWRRFAGRLAYRSADATDTAALSALKADLPAGPTVFYLAVSPDLYGGVCAALGAAGLATRQARLVLEKPLGRDLDSCRAINEAVAAVFAEDQLFRIDHYLGKETVQNLLALRFGNVLFEPLWNRLSIDHVQITVAETETVGERWPYYDRYGALRDMVQNHVLQLVCLLAMEPPAELAADAVRDQKVKVLRSLRPIGQAGALRDTVRGQYGEGPAGPAYAAERGQASDTESFVALRCFIDNWRWSGVPFYLRTGKRLPERRTEIVIQFRPVPHSVFGGALEPNQLVISLQPQEEISLTLMNKAPGLDETGMRLHSLPLRLSVAGPAGARRRIAYERLLLDALKGDPTLFVRRDEIEAAWRWIDGVTEAWAAAKAAPHAYPAGTWGPAAANEMIENDGRSWRE